MPDKRYKAEKFNAFMNMTFYESTIHWFGYTKLAVDYGLL